MNILIMPFLRGVLVLVLSLFLSGFTLLLFLRPVLFVLLFLYQCTTSCLLVGPGVLNNFFSIAILVLTVVYASITRRFV